MFSNLYPVAYLITLGALTGWFYFRDNQVRAPLFRKVFFGALLVYALSWLFASGSLSYKLVVLLRELVLLAVLPFLLSMFRKITWAYAVVLTVVLIGMKMWYFPALSSTFPQAAMTEKVQVDEAAELLLEVREGHRISEIQPILDQFNITVSPAFTMQDPGTTDLDDYYALDLPSANAALLHEVQSTLEKNQAVEWLEANEIINLGPEDATTTRTTPNRFGFNDPGVAQLWAFEEMKVEELVPILKKSKPVKKALIAILDTGVDAGHEDLAANYLSSKSKYDIDRRGHGTHCAGIAAAVSNNGKGIASFSPTNQHVRITSIKVLSDNGFGSQRNIINGMLEAADLGADVLSMSLGGPSSDRQQKAYQKAVAYAAKKGAIVVVAAGNSNRNARNYAPANTPGVIAVAAIDTALNKASFSNTVEDLNWGVAAPGVGIYSAIPANQYGLKSGTSMATPYVAGLLGVMKSLKPNLTTEQAYRILNDSGKKLKSSNKTGRLIQPAEALRLMLE